MAAPRGAGLPRPPSVGKEAAGPLGAYPDAVVRRTPRDDAEAHVVHLLPSLGAPAAPPQQLGFPHRMGAAGRTVLAVVNTGASIAAGAMIAGIWTADTPGLWFDVLFTVVIAGLAASLWGVFRGSVIEANQERALNTRWLHVRSHARAETGRVVNRAVNLSEDGAVSTFDIQVVMADRSTLRARWRPRTMSARSLPLAAVPDVGAVARVWRMPDETQDSPVVIEVADPSAGDPPA